MISRSLTDARVPSPSSFGHQAPFAMVEEVSGPIFFLAAAKGHLLNILVVKNSGPCPVEPGKAPSTTVAPETFGVTA